MFAYLTLSLNNISDYVCGEFVICLCSTRYIKQVYAQKYRFCNATFVDYRSWVINRVPRVM